MKIQLLIATLLVVGSLARGQNPPNSDSSFIAANRAYGEENFDEAINLYQNILSQDLESAEVYFNLGNSFYKIRNYPKAILNYERALLLDPRNENIKYNINKARIYNVDKIDDIPEFIIQRGINGIIGSFKSNTWAVISVFCFAAGLLLLLIYFLSMNISLKRIGFYSGIILLFSAILAFGISSRTKSLQQRSNGAIVISPTITIKGSPSEGGTDLFIIHEGTKVYLLDQLNDWYEIKLGDGKQGWLQQTDIEVI